MGQDKDEIKRKSFFSKDAISIIISEVIKFIDQINESTEGYLSTDKEELANYLLENECINETIYDTLVDYKIDNCHAMIQKKGKNRCSNPAKKGHQFCNFHINNPPDLTIEDSKRLEKLKT